MRVSTRIDVRQRRFGWRAEVSAGHNDKVHVDLGTAKSAIGT